MVILVRGVPVLPGQTPLREGIQKIIGSERSGCVVLQEGGARLYYFDILDQQMPEHAEQPIEEIEGGVVVPSVTREEMKLTAAQIALLSYNNSNATLGFKVDMLVKGLYNAVRVLRCNIDPFNHYFSAMKVKNLAPHPGGGYHCPTADGGQVT
jgi:hypothetical protein